MSIYTDWVSCDDQLPGQNKTVAVLEAWPDQATARISAGYLHGSTGWIVYGRDGFSVTHWCELPALPSLTSDE